MLSKLLTSSLKRYLDQHLPSGWEQFQTETILLELGSPVDDLLVDKVNLLRAMSAKPELFYDDALFFLHACEVLNDNVTDFTTLPHVTSLEAALAILEMSRITGAPRVEESYPFGDAVRETVKEILIDDGYSSPIWPFDSVGIVGLLPGSTEGDMSNKARAIKEYINGISGKPTA